MNRPGPVGIALVLAFAVIAVIEFRTVLGMAGIDIAVGPYFAGAAILLVGGGATLLAVPEERNPKSV